ncbi:MAG: NAD(P)-dependent alcohol dehydrogenase [Candidatus Promineifilaceae bacterium]
MEAVLCTRYGPPEVLELREVDKPAPREDELLIRMSATAVTASDCIVRGFKLSRWSPLGFMMGLAVGFTAPRQPILGMIVSGEVESVGSKVTRLRPGDAVYGSTVYSATRIRFGAYADYVTLPEKSLITRKPANLSFEEAAAIPYGYGLAIAYLKKGAFETREKILVYGASGAIGTTAVQLAKASGAEVTGVCSTRNLAFVRDLGADHLIDYTTTDQPPAGARYDLVLDAVGEAKSSRLKENCRQALSDGGLYVSVDQGGPNNTLDELELMNELVEAGKLRPLIDRTYKLGEMVEAHRYVDQGHKRGNVVVTI